MAKKVFFILSSFRAGGAERVFRLISQNFDKSRFEVTLVLLGTQDSFYSTQLDGVKVIDLKTVKASKSFWKLYWLLKKEKPVCVFSTGGQVNLLMAMVSFALNDLFLIARPTNQDNTNFLNFKAKVLSIFSRSMYKRFDKVICQSQEIKTFLTSKWRISEQQLTVIPNPVVLNEIVRVQREKTDIKHLIVVARLTKQKGISRLLDIMTKLPSNYHLSIAGDGVLRDDLAMKIVSLNLSERVKMLGVIKNVLEVVAESDLFVLPSFIEGFPNVIVESLSVGTPVISFKVGGISDIIIDGFNGFVVKQDDVEGFRQKVHQAADIHWDTEKIREDVFNRYSLEKVTKCYEQLIP